MRFSPQPLKDCTYNARPNNSIREKANSIVACFAAVAITRVFIISTKITVIPAKIITVSDCNKPNKTAADKKAFIGRVRRNIERVP